MKKLLILFFPIIAFGQSKITVTVPTGAGTVNTATSPLVVSGSNVSLTKTGIDTVGTIASGTWQGTNIDYTLITMQSLGSVAKSQVFGIDPSVLSAGGSTLTPGVMSFVACYVPTTFTVAGVKWYQITKGNAIETGYNGIELFSISGGTLTMIDSTARDTACWDVTSSTWGSKSFTSTHILNPGVYIIGFVWNRSSQTTAPSIAVSPPVWAGNVFSLDLTNSCKLSAIKPSVTSPIISQSMSGLTANNTLYYFYLY